MTDTQALVEVTQADREAAASLYLEQQGAPLSAWDHGAANDLRSGECDDELSIQAFARHRLASTQPLAEQLAERDATIARLRAALRLAADDLQTVGDDYPGSSCQKWCRERADFARAALSSTPEREWQPIETAPHACHVIAARFDRDAGEWIYGFVLSPPSKPFTHWRMPPEPPTLTKGAIDGE